MNYSYGMVMQPNDRIRLALIGSSPPASFAFYWRKCILLTQQYSPHNGRAKHFYEKWFEIRNQRPQITLDDNFPDFLTTLQFSRKLGPIFTGTRPRRKQHVPPLSHLSRWKVPKTDEHSLSFAYTSVTSGYFISHFLLILLEEGYFFKNVHYVVKTYTDEGLIALETKKYTV